MVQRKWYKISNKKSSKKWNRTHFFKRKKSNKKGVGHPVYVYSSNKRSYKYLLFTHKIPDDDNPENYVLLNHNIDRDKDGIEPTYMKKHFEVNRYTAFN